MTDATDTVLRLLLEVVDTTAPALTAFNGRLAEQKVMLDAANAKTAEASAVQGRYAASLDRAALASDRETAAALKAADRQIAAAQRVTVAVAREQEKQSAAVAAAATKTAKSLSLIGLGAAGVIYETSKMAASFQQNMEMIRTQAGASQAEVDRLTPQVLQLSSAVGFGPTSLAESLYHAESAGYREAAALQITANAAKLAQIGHADLETTTQALVGVMSSHIKGVKDAAEASAYLNQIVGEGDMRLSQLAQSIGTGVLPSFRNFGLGIRDFGAAIATLTDNLVPADEAATRLRMTVALLGAPSGAAAKALEAVGISASDANAALSHRDELATYGVHLTDLSTDLRKPDGLLVALEDLKKHLEGAGLSASEQGAVLTRAFGGGRSSAAILTLYNELDRLKSKYVDLGTGVQKFGDDWNATTKTTAFEAAQAKANFDALGITVGTAVVPAVSEFLKVITPAAQTLADFVAHNKTLVADALVAATAVGGIAAVVLALGKVTTAWKEIRTAAIAAGLAEDAALLGPLALVAGAVAGGVLVAESFHKTRDASESARQKFIEGKITLDQYHESLLRTAGSSARFGDSQIQAKLAEAEAAKVTYDHTQTIDHERTAFTLLGNKLVDSVGYWHAATAAKKGYYQFDGKGAAALSPGASDPKAGPAFDFQKQMTHATAMIDNWASKVIEDTQKFGAHSAQTAWATQMLDKWRATSATLDKEWQSLTGTTVKLKTAGLDPFTKGFQDAQKRLSDATAAIANDYVKGILVSAAQRKAFDDATASVKRYQAAQDAADGTTAAREKARQDKADAAQKAAWAKIDKGLDAQATKQEALAVAAEKAAQALLKVQRAAIEQSPVYQASVARYNATVNPAQQTGGLDPITIIENKIANLWNTSKSESDYEKTFGILSAQLAAAIKKYGDGVQKQFDKAGKDLENNPNIPGTDAWVKALEAQWKKVAASPAVVAGLANLGKAGGLAVGGTFGGQNASAGVAATNFQNQTNLGVLGARNADTSNLVNLNVATILKDTGTQFSILDALYLKGAKGLDGLVVTLPQVVDAYKADQVTVLASTRRLIDFDKATGNTADELTQTLNLYHQGNATLAESEQAYSDNAAAVAKVTAQDLAFLEGTGQWSAALSSITSSITGPLADANAKLVIDIMSGVGAREADIASVKNLQAAQDALAQATWDEQYSVANPAQQSQMLNTLAQPMISQQSSEASAAQAMNTAQLGVIAAESALEVQGINAMTTELADMGGIIKAQSAVQTAQFSGQLAALNDLIPIQNDMAAIQKATTPQMLQTAQEQLKIDRLTAAMDQNKASWDVKIAQMTLQLAQDKMMVDMANADAQRTIAVDNLVLAGDALNVQIASAKLQSDSLVIQNAIHTDLGGVQDYLSLIDGDLQNLTDAQNQQMSDQGMLAGDTGYANMLAASGAAMLGGDQLGIDSATAAATAANQAYQLQLAQYKVEQDSQQNLQQLVANSTADNAALLSEVKTLQNLIAFQNSPASRRPLHSVGNVSTAAMINSWAATAAATQAA